MNQRLDCYRILVDVAKAMPSLIANLPKGEGYLIVQLKRAIASAILNLAEGNGRYSTNDRNRFFNISMGSISEVEGGVEIASAYGYFDIDISQKLLNDLRKAYNMIRKLKR